MISTSIEYYSTHRCLEKNLTCHMCVYIYSSRLCTLPGQIKLHTSFGIISLTAMLKILGSNGMLSCQICQLESRKLAVPFIISLLWAALISPDPAMNLRRREILSICLCCVGWRQMKHCTLRKNSAVTTVNIINRRKFRGQTSDNMDRWKAEMGRVREEKRREEERS